MFNFEKCSCVRHQVCYKWHKSHKSLLYNRALVEFFNSSKPPWMEIKMHSRRKWSLWEDDSSLNNVPSPGGYETLMREGCTKHVTEPACREMEKRISLLSLWSALYYSLTLPHPSLPPSVGLDTPAFALAAEWRSDGIHAQGQVSLQPGRRSSGSFKNWTLGFYNKDSAVSCTLTCGLVLLYDSLYDSLTTSAQCTVQLTVSWH